MRRTKLFNVTLAVLAGFALSATMVMAADGGDDHSHHHDPGVLYTKDWSFDGPFGHFDQATLQRGFQVYKEVCATCHGLDFISFRNFEALGYNPAEIKAIAAEYEVVDGPNDEGELFTRLATPADRFPNPFPNENAARAANGGAYPPDLSLMIKARANGANYVYSLLVGYQDAPQGLSVPDGMYFNESYSGQLISMPQPLFGDDVTYADGSPTSVEALSADLVTFLAWTSEPELESRKRLGVVVIIFLLVMCVVSYGAKRHVWANVKK